MASCANNNHWIKGFQRENKDLIDSIGSIHNILYSTNISLKYRYLYFETPKVACSTIKSTLQRIELERPDYVHENAQAPHIRDISPLLNPLQIPTFRSLLKDNRYFKFAFVRNPYTTLLSAYLDKIIGNQPRKRKVLRELSMIERVRSSDISFEQFVNIVCKQSIDKMDAHWRPQYNLLMFEHIQYDFIGRFERFEDDFAFVGKRLFDDFGLYYKRQSPHQTNASSFIHQYYDDRLASLVAEKFQNDFEAFGYETTLPF